MSPRLLSLALVFLCSLASPAADRPNLVFILADDMGYGDIYAYNPRSIVDTLNLNRLASEGMMFTDAHTPSAVCTPTRYGVITGRYCWRTRLKKGVLNGYSTHLIDLERRTVADHLSEAGYVTGVVGKWHLGLDFAKGADGKTFDYAKPVAAGPNELGFHESFIIPASLDFPPYVFIRDGQCTALPTEKQEKDSFPGFLREGERSPDLVMEDVLDRLTDEATGFIRRHAAGDKPFFLYFPLTAPHKPLLPHVRFYGRNGLGRYADFVTQVDWTVSQVVKALEESGVKDNTMVVFTSDNGSYMYRIDKDDEKDHSDDATIQAYRAGTHTANGPFRGTKADIYEGGHRVPFIVRWPAKVKARTKCAKTICLTDWYATCAEVAGLPLLEQSAEDSFSLVPLLTGNDAQWKRAPVIHHSSGGTFAIRDGNWKLVLGNGSGGRENPKGKAFEKPYKLFSFEILQNEQQDVIEEQPEIATRLEAAWKQIHDSGRSR